ncbi:hypothetical protein K1719_000987 [Acacia pycnantha]|nr:hypothetical protein K1719_000987 [Acacia pycnantha]
MGFHILSDFDEGKRSCRRKLKRHNNRRRRKPTETRAAEDREVQLVKQTEDDVGKDSSHISSEINDLEISLELEDGQLAAPCSAPDTLNIKNDSFVSFVACGETQVNGGKENSNISYSPSYCEKSAYSSMCPTGRVSFMLYDWNPAEFPRRLRHQIFQWLASMPVELEGYIRPGCTILTVFVTMPKFMWTSVRINCRFDITQILMFMIHASMIDLLHNAHLNLEGLDELFKVAQALADGVIPNEYGINPKKKLKIGSKRLTTDATKQIIREAILEMLDLETFLHDSFNVIGIADLGCSVGPNTFFIVQNFIDTLNLKSQSQGHGFDSLEFQVVFNDHVGNDFNTLFKSLPEDKKYYAAAVAGSFHGRLFPESSIHVFNSTYALNWLSRVPKEIGDKNSPAYNKGKIFYIDEDKEVTKAYSAQFKRDFESFLNSRALEIVPGGIMTLTFLCVPPDTTNRFQVLLNIIGDVFVEMANKA